MKEDRTISYLSLLCIALPVLLIAYVIPRFHTFALLVTGTLAFLGYGAYLKWGSEKLIFSGGLLIRFALLFSVPSLSDDFYRFIWDGQLWHLGIHPFLFTPTQVMQQHPGLLSSALYQHLNSPDYFTVYPPIHQLVFWISTFISSAFGSVIIMRLFLIMGEIGTYFVIKKLLAQHGDVGKRISWYWLNPLVILEITGNLHFEGLMLGFFLGGMLFLTRKPWLSALLITLSISTKLIPLIFIPFIWWRLPHNQKIKWPLWLGLFTFLSFLPLWNPALIPAFKNSLDLYFQKFEFNASFYYLLRFLGFQWKGYNMIHTIGPALMIFTTACILFLSFWKSNATPLWNRILLIATLYLAFATTVHPWYVIPLMGYALFTRFRYPMLWSFLIFLTYAGYTATGFQEVYILTWVEYLGVGTLLFFEWKQKSLNPVFP